MILLQLSAGRGPIECCKAVGLAMKRIEKQSREQGIELDIIEAITFKESGCFKSVLLQLESATEGSAKQLAESWQGAMLWVCQSPFSLDKRASKRKRKNWFFSGKVYEVNEAELDHAVTFKMCRSSGAGGQHVNTTDSAVRATHTETGISVRVESERSQHANKRLAKALLLQKLAETQLAQKENQEKAQWQQHWEVERGNPVKTFIGISFKLTKEKKHDGNYRSN